MDAAGSYTRRRRARVTRPWLCFPIVGRRRQPQVLPESPRFSLNPGFCSSLTDHDRCCNPRFSLNLRGSSRNRVCSEFQAPLVPRFRPCALPHLAAAALVVDRGDFPLFWSRASVMFSWAGHASASRAATFPSVVDPVDLDLPGPGCWQPIEFGVEAQGLDPG